MAPLEAVSSIYTRFVDQIYSESGENMCTKCCIMKDHLELLINELKYSQLIIKILQEEIKSTSTFPKNQENLTDFAEYKSRIYCRIMGQVWRFLDGATSDRAMPVRMTSGK